ncbi:MAG: dehydrogenase [Phycisphaerae bacterium]
MARPDRLTRRDFLAATTTTAAALTAGSLFSARTAAAARRTLGANERITIGLIGSGGQGKHDTAKCIEAGNVACIALCDVAEFRLNEADATVSQAMDKRNITGVKVDRYEDYRHLLDRKDIDAVVIATPDHWHTKPFIAACEAQKHIYQEKPFCYSIEAGQAMLAAAKKNPNTIQIGTQRRSGTHYPKAKALIDEGKIGKITYVRAFDCRNYLAGRDPFAPRDVAGKIDWDKFQEPCESKVDYDPWRYFAWRWFWEYAGGLVTDVGVHVMDVVHWLTGVDTPKTAVCNGGVYGLKYWQTPDVVNAVWDYGSHTVVFTGNFTNGYEGDGLTLYGTKGTIDIGGTYIRVYEEGNRQKTVAEFGPEGGAHQHNWIECIRTGNTPNAPVELGFKSLLPSLMANLAYRKGTKITWDAQAQKVV